MTLVEPKGLPSHLWQTYHMTPQIPLDTIGLRALRHGWQLATGCLGLFSMTVECSNIWVATYWNNTGEMKLTYNPEIVKAGEVESLAQHIIEVLEGNQ